MGEFDTLVINSLVASFPSVNLTGARGSELRWEGNEARWCLWPGVYNGVEHWKTLVNVASLRPPQLTQLFQNLVLPLNRSLDVPQANPIYNLFHVRTPHGE